MTAASGGGGPAAAIRPARSEALSPVAQSAAHTWRTFGGKSTISGFGPVAPRTTMTGSHPPSRSAVTVARSQAPPSASTLGFP